MDAAISATESKLSKRIEIRSKKVIPVREFFATAKTSSCMFACGACMEMMLRFCLVNQAYFPPHKQESMAI